MEKVYTIKELSTLLNISISMIRKLIRERRIPFYRIGNKIYFNEQSIITWIKKLEERENKYNVLFD